MANRPRDEALPLLVALGVLTRLLCATDSPLVNGDAYHYLSVAALFGAGEWGEALRYTLHPLYPLLVALVELPGIEARAAGTIVSLAATAAAVAALHGLVLEGWDRPAARAAAFLYAVHPVLASMEGKVMTEAAYHAFAFGAVLFLWRALRTGSWRPGLLAGACLGLAYLTRAEALLLALLLAGVGGMGLCLRPYRRSWPAIGLAVVAAVAVAAPYLVWLRVEHGSWTVSPRPSVQQAAGEDTPAQMMGSRSDRERVERYGRAGAAVVAVTGKAAKVYYAVPAVLALLTLVFFRRGSSGGMTGLFLGALAAGNLAALVVFNYRSQTPMSERYVSTAAALLLPWAAWGLARTGAWIGARRPALAAAFALVVTVSLLARSFTPADAERRHGREAADWLRENGGAGARMSSSRDSIVWHAGGTFVYVPMTERLGATVDRKRVRFLVFEDDDLAKMDPEARRSFFESDRVSRLRRFGPDGEGVAVYEVRPR